jgi:hypothetical protein
MFDPAACVGLRVMTAPSVSCEALGALQALLRTMSRSVADGVLQAQHRSLPVAEVLMRQSVIPPRLSQPTLFRPLPSRPLFQTLPPEIQAKTIRLLAWLLREHIDLCSAKTQAAMGSSR